MPDYAKAFPNSPIMHVDGDTQIACNDLPGETVRCIRKKPKLRVVLRKHRDVVFDINLGLGGQYSVESEQSDFYNTRDKKLIRPKTQVVFSEGERLHLWVSRTFMGALLLKHNGKLIARYEPNQLDPHTCTAQNPEGKPAPLIVSMQLPHFDVLEPIQTQLDKTTEYYEKKAQMIQKTIYVVEVKDWGKEIPLQIVKFLQNGGKETAIDDDGVLTRNWLLSQLIGTTESIYHQREIVKDLISTKFYLKAFFRKNGTKVYHIVFKGTAGARKIIKASRYLSNNSQVISITHGTGSFATTAHQSWNTLKGSVGKGTAISIIFTIGIDLAEWLKAFQTTNSGDSDSKFNLLDLFTTVGLDITKGAISAAATEVAVSGILFITSFVVGTAGLPFVALLIGTVFIAVAVSTGIDFIDKKYKITDKIGQKIKSSVEELGRKNSNDYSPININPIFLAP
ncbi:hypothetical protein [Limnobacter litoralis]|uniref:Uncharacterized protein n=1 Tax=Limnobacter litoralis TaxID=481366 RepID=A0ABQ5YSR2_9BURK|nr:hypothetical protein [Limnobacter litoralis]GLR27102.1 hypothetical protein GCM10007875_21930 [Limnobacter litoralis]